MYVYTISDSSQWSGTHKSYRSDSCIYYSFEISSGSTKLSMYVHG